MERLEGLVVGAGFGGLCAAIRLREAGIDGFAVIGSAARAIQVMPKIARAAARADVWRRTPDYIAARVDFACSDTQRRRFARWPLWLRDYRWIIRERMDRALLCIVVDPRRRALGRTVRATGCKSRCKRPDGRGETRYPRNAAAYAPEMRQAHRDALVIAR